MSADNYMHIIKRDGKYVVTHRSASAYYRDEGWTEDNPPLYHPYGGGVVEKHPEWIIEDTEGRAFDSLEDANAYAHSEYTEYGVSYGFSVKTIVVDEDDS